MIKIVPAIKLKQPGKPADGGWRHSQKGPEAIGAAMGTGEAQANVSNRDADLIASMMDGGETVPETSDVAYPAAKCGRAPTVINPDKDTVAQMMIQNWIKQSGGAVILKDEDKLPPAGPKLLLG